MPPKRFGLLDFIPAKERREYARHCLELVAAQEKMCTLGFTPEERFAVAMAGERLRKVAAEYKDAAETPSEAATLFREARNLIAAILVGPVEQQRVIDVLADLENGIRFLGEKP